MRITLEIANWLRTRVAGLAITSLHGRPETTERLLGALATPNLDLPTATESPHV
jgi:hypothetical protein